MHEISWWVILLYSIPQLILYIYLGFQLVNIRPIFYKIIIIALIYSPFIYGVRRLDLPYGFHSIILTLIVMCLAYIILQLPIFTCVVAVMIGSIAALTLETLLLPIAIEITNITFHEVINSDLYSIVFSAPQLLVLIIINIYLHNRKTYLINLYKGV